MIVEVFGVNKDKIDIRDGDKWAQFDIQGNILEMGKTNPYTNFRPTDAELREWLQYVIEHGQELVNNSKWADIDLYIRFGELPKGGRSRNYATGGFEAGVSCYEAEYVARESCFRLTGNVYNPGALIGHQMAGSKIYLITGKCVCCGGDGEPVLRRIKVLGELSPDQNVQGFKLI